MKSIAESGETRSQQSSVAEAIASGADNNKGHRQMRFRVLANDHAEATKVINEKFIAPLMPPAKKKGISKTHPQARRASVQSNR
jgi:hypothetical protein